MLNHCFEMTASIYYSGNIYTQIKKVVDVFSLPIFCGKIFYKILKSTVSSLDTVYQNYKNHIIKNTCSTLDISGDGRSKGIPPNTALNYFIG